MGPDPAGGCSCGPVEGSLSTLVAGSVDVGVGFVEVEGEEDCEVDEDGVGFVDAAVDGAVVKVEVDEVGVPVRTTAVPLEPLPPAGTAVPLDIPSHSAASTEDGALGFCWNSTSQTLSPQLLPTWAPGR
jgi:hypothetical protein